MCKSNAEGGQRCAAHTREKFERVSRADDKWDGVAAAYASTPEGHERLTREAAIAEGQHDYELMSRTQIAINKGESMRAASKEAAAQIELRAAEFRQKAADARQRSADSFERSDTDGALSQWAADSMAQKYDLEARLAEQGGQWNFPALFNTEGHLVPAKLIDTKYGQSWALLEDGASSNSRFSGFVNRSKASKAATRRANLAKKGYTEGTVRVPARVASASNGSYNVTHYLARSDGGFSVNAEIVSSDSDTRDH